MIYGYKLKFVLFHLLKAIKFHYSLYLFIKHIEYFCIYSTRLVFYYQLLLQFNFYLIKVYTVILVFTIRKHAITD